MPRNEEKSAVSLTLQITPTQKTKLVFLAKKGQRSEAFVVREALDLHDWIQNAEAGDRMEIVTKFSSRVVTIEVK